MPEANSHLRLEVFVTPAKPISIVQKCWQGFSSIETK